LLFNIFLNILFIMIIFLFTFKLNFILILYGRYNNGQFSQSNSCKVLITPWESSSLEREEILVNKGQLEQYNFCIVLIKRILVNKGQLEQSNICKVLINGILVNKGQL